jgi:hypothetical protein
MGETTACFLFSNIKIWSLINRGMVKITKVTPIADLITPFNSFHKVFEILLLILSLGTTWWLQPNIAVDVFAGGGAAIGARSRELPAARERSVWGATEGGTQPKGAMVSCAECGAAIGGLTRARGQAARERSKNSAREGGAVAKERDYFCAEGDKVIGAR